MKRYSGFTLIELLIVIALIGILAVALLSAINPLEQLRKGRDTARKADSAELLNAIERFYSSYQCYPWSYASGACTFPATVLTGTPNPSFVAATNQVYNLIAVNEIKQAYVDRVAPTTGVSSAPSYLNLFLSENSTGNIVSVCFEPESTTGRTGGLGTTRNVTNTAAATCGAATYAGRSATAACYVCVPQ